MARRKKILKLKKKPPPRASPERSHETTIMQPTFSSSRILLPVRSWSIALSLIVALLLNMLLTVAAWVP